MSLQFSSIQLYATSYSYSFIAENFLNMGFPTKIPRDLNARWEAFATATEQTAANGDSRKLFKLMKEGSCQKPQICETLQDRDGNVITAREKLSLRTREHFLELLNHDAAQVTADSPTGNGDSPPHDWNLDVPTVTEIKAVVRGL